MADSINDRNSRYVQGGVTTVHENRLGWWERRTFASDVTDIEYTIEAQYHQRPDKLAFDVYGKASYQFLILQYNSILDINEEFVDGKEILIPTPQRVAMDFITLPTGGEKANG